MEFLQLIYFEHIASCQNISKAARELHVSQPALSSAIIRLEKELGVQLFDRIGRRILLNDSGIQFLETTRDILKLMNTSKKNAKMHLMPTGTVNIAMGIMSDRFLDCLKCYSLYNPNVTFQLLSGDNIKGRIGLSLADFVIMSGDVKSDIESIIIDQQNLYVVLPKAHPLSGAKTLDLTDLKEEKFVFILLREALLEKSYRLCTEAGFTPKVAYLVDNIHAKMVILSREMAIGITPSTDLSLMASNQNLAFIPLRNPPTNQKIAMGWNSNIHLSPAATSFLDYALKYFHG